MTTTSRCGAQSDGCYLFEPGEYATECMRQCKLRPGNQIRLTSAGLRAAVALGTISAICRPAPTDINKPGWTCPATSED
jgi:hypothetical protein